MHGLFPGRSLGPDRCAVGAGRTAGAGAQPRGRGTRGGRPPKCPRRRVVDAILYVARTGCSWRQLPHDFPPWETVFYYFQRWTAEGTVDRLHAALRDAVRDADDRDPMASAGVVDSQSVPGAATVGKASRGFD